MRLISPALVVGVLFLAGCQRSSPADRAAVVARWRFLGSEALASQTNAPQLRQVLNLPEAALVTPAAVSNVAQHLAIRLTASTNPALAAQLLPLVQAMIRFGSSGEIGADGWSLALKLPSSEAVAVQNSVRSLPRLAGQEAGLPAIQFTNGWLLAGSTPAWMDRASRLPALGVNGLLTGEFDLAAIFQLDARRWPRVQLDLNATNGMVRTTGALTFAASPVGELPPWKVPNDYLRDPIIRFTAVRGIESLVQDNEWFRVLSGGPVPDQFFSWSQPEVSFRTWFAAPVSNGMARIPKLHEALKERVSSNSPSGGYTGILILNSNKSAIAVYKPLGIPGLLPSIGVVSQGTQDFLLTSLIHPAKTTNEVPAELLAELDAPALVYYDWEITAAAVPNWNVLFQYNNLARGRRANAPWPHAHKWMLAAAPKLGNSVTSIRREGPTRYALTRNSGAGLTALELVLLTRWLDGPIGALPGEALPASPRPKR